MNGKEKILELLAILSAASFLGCADRAWTVEAAVRVPEPPPHWAAAFPGLHYLARFLGPDGVPTEQAVCGTSAAVVLSGTVNGPVLLVPVARGVELPPAGCLYPWSLASGGTAAVLEASWKDGCAASILFLLQKAGFDVAALNGRRLLAELRERDDPWGTDPVRVAEAFLAGDMSSRLLQPAPSRPVRLSPGAGTWFLESPFARAFRVEAGQVLSLGGVPLGFHRLFALDGGAPAGIQVGEDGVTVFTGSPCR